MTQFLRCLFFVVLVRPILTVILGANVRGRELLPPHGPAIIVANHNSHLDTLTIMAMYKLGKLKMLRPVAAMDYFMRNRALAWLVTNIMGVIPVSRGGLNRDLLGRCSKALDDGDILILFPEGSRGEPEKLSIFKKGVGHLAKARPLTPVIPLFLHGLGKALPKDSYILVPFNCDVVVGEAFFWADDMEAFMTSLQARMTGLASQIHMAPWE
jgi:1-acyl-sn-glycerol-3-phosphate acyltransferase